MSPACSVSLCLSSSPSRGRLSSLVRLLTNPEVVITHSCSPWSVPGVAGNIPPLWVALGLSTLCRPRLEEQPAGTACHVPGRVGALRLLRCSESQRTAHLEGRSRGRVPRREASFVSRHFHGARRASPANFLVSRNSCVWNALQATSLPRVMRKAPGRSPTWGLERERTEIRDPRPASRKEAC